MLESYLLIVWGLASGCGLLLVGSLWLLAPVRTALKPFAAIKEIDDRRFDDSQPVMLALNGSWVWYEDECQLTLGDFRRARAALEKI